MGRKARPVVVEPVADVPAAPAGLGEAGRSLWDAINSEFGGLEAREVAVLEAACRQADDVAALEALMASDGLVTQGSMGQPKLVSAVSEARQGRLALARLLNELRLPSDVGVGDSPASARARHAAGVRWDLARDREGRGRGV